jgi:hypothetical protein
MPISGSRAASALKFGGKTSMSVVKMPLLILSPRRNYSITFCLYCTPDWRDASALPSSRVR